VLMALAEGAAAFAPGLSALPRAGGIAAACPARATPVASRPVRAAPLRLGGLQMAAANIPITVTGTNIEVCRDVPWRPACRFGGVICAAYAFCAGARI
jgi:hypothetical protein